jgi:hypothetical protein
MLVVSLGGDQVEGGERALKVPLFQSGLEVCLATRSTIAAGGRLVYSL